MCAFSETGDLLCMRCLVAPCGSFGSVMRLFGPTLVPCLGIYLDMVGRCLGPALVIYSKILPGFYRDMIEDLPWFHLQVALL